MSKEAPKRRSAYNLTFSTAMRNEAFAAIYYRSIETDVFETLRSVVVFGCKCIMQKPRRELLISFNQMPSDWHVGTTPTYLMLNDADAELLRDARNTLEAMADQPILQTHVMAYAIRLARHTLAKRSRIFEE